MNLFFLKFCNIFKIKLNILFFLFIISKSIDGNNFERIIYYFNMISLRLGYVKIIDYFFKVVFIYVFICDK